MKKLIKKNWFTIVAAIMLIFAVPKNFVSYDYLILLRWVVCGVAVYNAYLAKKTRNKSCMFAMLAIAIVFNPIFPITFGKSVWQVLDIITAIVLFISVKKIKK